MSTQPSREPSLQDRLARLMSETPTPERITALRQMLGMSSQQKLADALDVSRQSVNYWETGAMPIDQRTWYSIILLLVARGAL